MNLAKLKLLIEQSIDIKQPDMRINFYTTLATNNVRISIPVKEAVNMAKMQAKLLAYFSTEDTLVDTETDKDSFVVRYGKSFGSFSQLRVYLEYGFLYILHIQPLRAKSSAVRHYLSDLLALPRNSKVRVEHNSLEGADVYTMQYYADLTLNQVEEAIITNYCKPVIDQLPDSVLQSQPATPGIQRFPDSILVQLGSSRTIFCKKVPNKLCVVFTSYHTGLLD